MRLQKGTDPIVFALRDAQVRILDQSIRAHYCMPCSCHCAHLVADLATYVLPNSF